MTKPIEGHPGYYVSDEGIVTGPSGEVGFNNSAGYRAVCFPDKDSGQKIITVHRLVANAFVPGRTEEKCVVDHIDGNKQNNRADNLRWATRRENLLYALTEQKILPERQRPIAVKAIYEETGESKEFISINDAAKKLKLPYWHVNEAVHGKRNKVKGWIFEILK